MKEKSADNVGQAYLSGIFTHIGGSIAILSVNGIELKNAILTDSCEQLGIRNCIQPIPSPRELGV